MLITCTVCGKEVEATRKTKKYCSMACAMRAYRSRKGTKYTYREEIASLRSIIKQARTILEEV